MGKFTPGPWEVREVTDYYGCSDEEPTLISRGVAQAGGRGINTGEEFEMYSIEDANLIAAAPDLYVVLKSLMNEANGCIGAFEADLREIIGNTNVAAMLDRIEKAQAALRKADGEG